MKNLIFLEIRQILFSIRFWCAALIGLLLMLRPLFAIYANGINNLYSPMMMLSIPLALSDFTPFAPIFSILPYATRFCDEYQSKYMRPILIRIGEKKYCMLRIIVTGFSGGLALGFIFLCSILLCMITAGAPHSIESADFLINTVWGRAGLIAPFHGIWIYIGRILLAFFFGVLWSVIALLISTICVNKYVTLIAPFVLYQASWVSLTESALNPLYLLRADYAGIPSLGFVFVIQALMIFLFSLLSYCGIRRRCKDA